jgi:alpha-glucan, water dikinase
MPDNLTTQEIAAGSGVVLRASVRSVGDGVEIHIEKRTGPSCILHWGVVHAGGGSWETPPDSAWPAGSKPATRALDTPLGDGPLDIRLDAAWRFAYLDFVLFDPKRSSWDSNQGRNYRLVLPEPAPAERSTSALAQAMAGDGELIFEARHGLDDGCQLGIAVRSSDSGVTIALATDVRPPLSLYWGVGANRREWKLPEPALRPTGTSQPTEQAVETAFREEHGLRALRISMPSGKAPSLLCFVLHQPGLERWWKDRGRNFFVPLAAQPAGHPFQDPALAAVADEIIEKESGAGSWTLMHRFDLAWELLDRVPRDSVAGLGLIFVWLRFSAIRQLDWQRNFNTKPRELAHAQDRLTSKLGERAAQADDSTRPLIRIIATTLGRGGDGQRVRDGILEIMHRNHVKEVAGRFLEEWHQKLHNNTTPDDVVICEAYLEFLRRNGDQEAFYRTLEAGGVSRARLLGFERPIRSAPDFMGNLRDALLRDFSDFLGVLRAVHSATDFGTALQAARGFVDEATRQALDGIWRRRDEKHARSWLVQSITQSREVLAGQFHQGRAGARELLYLDLGLEDLMRNIVERNLGEPLSMDELVEWTELGLRNLVCVRKSEELSLCLRHLKRLAKLARGGHAWALHAQAVLERIRREVVRITDADAQLLQPIAVYLGQAFGAQAWTIQTFAEEVLRGRFEFGVSALLRKLDELLRQIAGLGHWQIVSRGPGAVEGMVESCGGLAEVQGRRFDKSTILVADRVSGEEDIPGGVVAVLTASPVDLMAHAAVRARNAGVLLATGFDGDRLAGVRSKQGQWVRLVVAVEGEITVEAGLPSSQPAARPVKVSRAVTSIRPPSEYAMGEDAFAAEKVGAKSRNLRALRGRLPEWISVPAGIALPYGVCERVLGHPANQARARRHEELVAQLRKAEAGKLSQVLAELRKVILDLEPPSELEVELRRVTSGAGIPWPSSFADAWQCIKLVWASKWNERAYYSRRSMGVPDENLMMAVLVQEVVPADYAFVIHTANPITGDRDELVAEIVVGLGESLVGNHPGRAFGFRRHRSKGATQITSFPSKSEGLFGQGLMFRSDSSGEDLMGFAGAGLYDSFMLPQARHRPLDYEREELLWNEELRNKMVEGVADVGAAVEKVFGAPQDIEGVYANGRFFVVQSRPQVGLDHG